MNDWYVMNRIAFVMSMVSFFFKWEMGNYSVKSEETDY
jgi:hypothetical protein